MNTMTTTAFDKIGVSGGGVAEHDHGYGRAIIGLRMNWLNALIVGATILVWLTLAGMVLSAIYVATSLGSDSPSVGNISDLTNDMVTTPDTVPDNFWIDNEGNVCDLPVTASGICP